MRSLGPGLLPIGVEKPDIYAPNWRRVNRERADLETQERQTWSGQTRPDANQRDSRERPAQVSMDRENRRGVEGHAWVRNPVSRLMGCDRTAPVPTDPVVAGIKPGRRFSRFVRVPQPDGPAGN